MLLKLLFIRFEKEVCLAVASLYRCYSDTRFVLHRVWFRCGVNVAVAVKLICLCRIKITCITCLIVAYPIKVYI